MNKIKVELTEDQAKYIIDLVDEADPNRLFMTPFTKRIITKFNKALAKAKS